ncbi:hypothetical protein [Alishewanella longhuensis]
MPTLPAPWAVRDRWLCVEQSKDRALTLEELTQVFKVFRENTDSFARENYLACALLVTLGVRKSELTEASWQGDRSRGRNLGATQRRAANPV